MGHGKLIASLFLLCYPFSLFAEVEFSQIDEKILLNPQAEQIASDKVIIYSRVRDKTINRAMDNQFSRIDNMMFVNTIIESEKDGQVYMEDDDCDD